ncbi:MAG TPA: glycoside hydrolase family 2 protein [Clostridiales bacterium]|nr:glycoside hydrolase family 2 protein [Clostridiales bacterium]
MKRINFNDNWRVKRENDHHSSPNPAIEVQLPHDAMFTTQRNEKAWNGTKKAFFENGTWEYAKIFEAPEEWKEKHVVLEFEGIYSQSMIYLNGSFAGQRPYGYSEFAIELDKFLRYGERNELKVIARSSDDSRWYSGAGIYRNVNLLVSELIHIPVNGVRISTQEASEKKAVIYTEIKVENLSVLPCVTARVHTEICALDGTVVGKDTSPVTLTRSETVKMNQRIHIPSPKLWSVDTPELYTCKTTLTVNGEKIDSQENRFGIRTLMLDVIDGLQINGSTVKLRGCCIHHDNGVIGARTFPAAEYRRIRKLKEAGFNAIRSSHHPASRALLDACDELGMLVMDEAFDMWTICKSSGDYALHFPTWWEKDIEAMVNKDYNHPSVVIYSIGNEISDVETGLGTAWGRKIAQKIQELDTTRFTTNSVNGMLCVMGKIQEYMAKMQQAIDANNGDINATMANAGQGMGNITQIPEIGHATEETFSTVDIAGYNYMVARYDIDHEQYPNRIIVGSETFTKDIPEIWKLVTDNAHVIGDFAWTGWDYLGETGIGRVGYEGNLKLTNFSFYGEYPWITAWCGDIDITGYRLPASYYREIVYGLRNQPYIAVQRPEHYGKTPSISPWSWSDSVSSWSWEGFGGKPIVVEVYSAADEVELLLDGAVIGRKQAGEGKLYKAEFDTTYRPGRLEAVAYTNGVETGTYSLGSAAEELILTVHAERPSVKADGKDLAYINIELTDRNGNLHTGKDRAVTLTLDGEGELIGFGSGSPVTTESYLDGECTTYNGRALAVILPKDTGVLKVAAITEGCEAVTVDILVS